MTAQTEVSSNYFSDGSDEVLISYVNLGCHNAITSCSLAFCLNESQLGSVKGDSNFTHTTRIRFTMAYQQIELDLTDQHIRDQVIHLLAEAHRGDPAWADYYHDGTDRLFKSMATYSLTALSEHTQTMALVHTETGELASVLCWSEPGVDVSHSTQWYALAKAHAKDIEDYLSELGLEEIDSPSDRTVWKLPSADEMQSSSLEIQWLATLPKYQAQGLATGLIKWLEESLGAHTGLYAGTMGTKNHECYRKWGFKPILERSFHSFFGAELRGTGFYKPINAEQFTEVSSSA